MIPIILKVATVAASIAVYFDATTSKIGKAEDTKSFTNMSAGAWAAACLIIPIIALPVYLFNRGALIKRARLHPIVVSQKRKIASLLLLLFFGGLMFLPIPAQS